MEETIQTNKQQPMFHGHIYLLNEQLTNKKLTIDKANGLGTNKHLLSPCRAGLCNEQSSHMPWPRLQEDPKETKGSIVSVNTLLSF